MSRASAVLAAGVCGLVLAACGRTGGGDETAAPPALPVVEFLPAEVRPVQPTISLPAVVESLESSRLRPQISATVAARHVTPGAQVEEGELLYEFDDADYAIALQQAEAAVAQAQAQSREAIAEWERAQRLKPQGAISQQAYDAAEAANSVASSRIAEARAQVQKARNDLQHTRVFAPFDGRISAAYHAVGDYVTPASPEPLCEIVRLDPIYVTVQIDQKLYYDITQRTQAARQEGRDLAAQLSTNIRLPNGVMYPFAGRFVNWDNTAVAATGTVGARAEFPNEDGLLLPGNNVLIEQSIDEPVDSLVIPQRAVSQDQQGHYVLIVNADDVVERRNLVVGMRIGPDWVVREGLTEGARVIVNGLQRVRLGIQVDPLPVAAAAAP
ncbi:MAG: efflux RND transporter periplasmic adaptor subunit [Woeseiaceae bacterium]|nr:efflux RND transporter periplasmic adaptor subunit [Woeseiaceae bacterium]